MQVAYLIVMAVLALPIPATFAAQVPPNTVEEIRQMALAADRKAVKPVPEKTPEQVAARKKAIKNHCEGFFARVAERGVQMPDSCQ